MTSYNNRDALIMITVLCSTLWRKQSNKTMWDINTHETRKNIIGVTR